MSTYSIDSKYKLRAVTAEPDKRARLPFDRIYVHGKRALATNGTTMASVPIEVSEDADSAPWSFAADFLPKSNSKAPILLDREGSRLATKSRGHLVSTDIEEDDNGRAAMLLDYLRSELNAENPEGWEICLNADKLAELASALGTSEVRIRLRSGNFPWIVRPLRDYGPEDDCPVGLFMPCKGGNPPPDPPRTASEDEPATDETAPEDEGSAET